MSAVENLGSITEVVLEDHPGFRGVIRSSRTELRRPVQRRGPERRKDNALYIALKDLSRRRADIRRQAIIVLSDGEDTSSLVTFDQVLELTKDTNVTIYTISLRREAGCRSKHFSEAEHVLKKLAEETGGQWFFPGHIDELESTYERIAKELKSQYNIGYVSNNSRRDGSWRRVVVQTASDRLLVRTKLGYYAPRN